MMRALVRFVLLIFILMGCESHVMRARHVSDYQESEYDDLNITTKEPPAERENVTENASVRENGVDLRKQRNIEGPKVTLNMNTDNGKPVIKVSHLFSFEDEESQDNTSETGELETTLKNKSTTKMDTTTTEMITTTKSVSESPKTETTLKTTTETEITTSTEGTTIETEMIYDLLPKPPSESLELEIPSESESEKSESNAENRKLGDEDKGTAKVSSESESEKSEPNAENRKLGDEDKGTAKVSSESESEKSEPNAENSKSENGDEGTEKVSSESESEKSEPNEENPKSGNGDEGIEKLSSESESEKSEPSAENPKSGNKDEGTAKVSSESESEKSEPSAEIPKSGDEDEETAKVSSESEKLEPNAENHKSGNEDEGTEKLSSESESEKSEPNAENPKSGNKDEGTAKVSSVSESEKSEPSAEIPKSEDEDERTAKVFSESETEKSEPNAENPKSGDEEEETAKVSSESESEIAEKRKLEDEDEVTAKSQNIPPFLINFDIQPVLQKAFEQKISMVSSVVRSINNILKQIYESIQPQNYPTVYAIVPTNTLPYRSLKKREVSDCTTENLPCPQEGYFRMNNSCTKYYECKFSDSCKKILSKIRTCPKCLKFNAKKRICDLPENVPECTYLSSKRFCTGPGQFFVPGDCHKYYDCKEGTNNTIDLNVKVCPPAMVFNQKDGKCVRRRCNYRLPKCSPDKDYIGDKFNCGKYYYCFSEKEFISANCPEGLVFDGLGCEKWEESKLNWEKKKKVTLKMIN